MGCILALKNMVYKFVSCVIELTQFCCILISKRMESLSRSWTTSGLPVVKSRN